MADTKTVTETKKMTETKMTTETKTNTMTKISCLKGYVPSCLFLTPVTSVLHICGYPKISVPLMALELNESAIVAVLAAWSPYHLGHSV